MRVLLCGNDEAGLLRFALDLTAASSAMSAAVLAAGTTTGEFRVVREELEGIEVHRAERADLHPNHWHKSASVSVRESFRTLLENGQFDLVHVLSWRGLTRDLVATASSLRVPAVVSLEGDWTNCLLPKRVQPADAASGKPCTLRHSAGVCLSCARTAEPRTPWVPIENEYIAFAERSNAIKAELKLAAALLAESAASVERQRELGDALADREVCVASLEDAKGMLGVYERAVTAELAAGSAPEDPAWYEERMERFKEQEWDKSCREAGA